MSRLIVVFADGLGFHYLARQDIRNAFGAHFSSIIPIRSLLGYSDGIIPSIWTSSLPEEHGYWARWVIKDCYDKYPVHLSAWKWKLETIMKYLEKSISSKVGKATEVSPSVPSAVIPFFKRKDFDTSTPFYSAKPQSIFHIMRENQMDFGYRSCRRIEDINPNESSAAAMFFYLEEFDRLGHEYGPDSPIIQNRISKLASHIGTVKTQSSQIILFSDHGMFPIVKRINLLEILSRLKSLLGKDYMVFLDSTMARFWFFSEASKDEITRALSGVSMGHFLTTDEIHASGLRFATNSYGDAIFLANPGYEIFPNFYHPLFKRYFKGLHGFSTSAENSHALFASTIRINNTNGSVLDIAPTILRFLDLKSNGSWRGTSLLK